LDCHLYNFDRSKVNYIPDIEDGQTATTGLLCLPILLFINRHVHPENRPHQVHGIFLRAKPDVEDGYERTGYFWTADENIAGELWKEDTPRKHIWLL
jgi:hypothetical protein